MLPSGVLLNTDGGLWQIPFPSPGSVPFSGSLPFRMVLQYGDTTRQVRSGDTVRLGQDHLRMLIDIIRPAGNGALKYQYRMAEGPGHWRDLNANELVFGKLPAGRPLALFLRAHDDVWRSGTLTFTLFAIPYWWQTAPWVQLIWLAAAFGAALIISFIIWLTRKRIERNVGKRNQLLELELKAIYAQLNPHFVFNTLNGALYLIRKQQAEEAYLHISRFSSLLRAYLKSSRNRFITLSEEISNMENYLLLQQTRFAHIFTYEIKTTGITIPDRIHIPSLILQPIVENAINHGLQQKQNKGHIKIAFELDPETKALICTVEDNGIGRKKAREAAGQKVNEKESYGNELISELINLFNRYERMGISLYYTDKQDPESGTVVTIVIKRPRYEYHR